SVQWEDLFARPVLIVSGKGGTGKSVVAAALAATAATSGRRTLLVEVEGRGEITRTIGIPDPGFAEVATPQGFSALSISPRAAALEYLHLFFGMDKVSRPLLRAGAEEMAVAETVEAVPAIEATGVPVSAVTANRCQQPVFGRGVGATGRGLGPGDVGRVAKEAGLSLSDEQSATVAENALAADQRFALQRGFLRELRRHAPLLTLPDVPSLDPKVVVAGLAREIAGERQGGVVLDP